MSQEQSFIIPEFEGFELAVKLQLYLAVLKLQLAALGSSLQGYEAEVQCHIANATETINGLNNPKAEQAFKTYIRAN